MRPRQLKVRQEPGHKRTLKSPSDLTSLVFQLIISCKEKFETQGASQSQSSEGALRKKAKESVTMMLQRQGFTYEVESEQQEIPSIEEIQQRAPAYYTSEEQQSEEDYKELISTIKDLYYRYILVIFDNHKVLLEDVDKQTEDIFLSIERVQAVRKNLISIDLSKKHQIKRESTRIQELKRVFDEFQSQQPQTNLTQEFMDSEMSDSQAPQEQ